MLRGKIGNSGFSLVEVIIVVAIIAVLTGTLGYGLSFVSGKPAQECAQKTVSVLQHARTTTMGKYKLLVCIRNDGGRIIIEQTAYNTQNDYNSGSPVVTTTAVGAKGVRFEYGTDGTSYTQLEDGDSVNIEFSRSTGELKPEASGNYWSCFRISKAHTVKNISIVPLTGRIKICD